MQKQFITKQPYVHWLKLAYNVVLCLMIHSSPIVNDEIIRVKRNISRGNKSSLMKCVFRYYSFLSNIIIKSITVVYPLFIITISIHTYIDYY